MVERAANVGLMKKYSVNDKASGFGSPFGSSSKRRGYDPEH